MAEAGGDKSHASIVGFQSRLAELTAASPTPQLSTSLAKLEHRMARIEEVAAAMPRSAAEAAELYQVTGPQYRRLIDKKENEISSVDPTSARLISLRATAIPDAYRTARDLYARSLLELPLDLEARTGLLYLDFVDPDSTRTRELIEQLRLLYRNNPKQLIALAEFSAQARFFDMAAQMWHDALVKMPWHTRNVLVVAAKFPEIEISEIVPDHPTAMRIAAREILADNKMRSIAFLPTTLEGISCERCKSVKEKASCLELGGDIAYQLGRYDEAFVSYDQAIQLIPTQGNLRYKTVMRFRDLGKHREALLLARESRQVLPQDARFDRVIKQMAAAAL